MLPTWWWVVGSLYVINELYFIYKFAVVLSGTFTNNVKFAVCKLSDNSLKITVFIANLNLYFIII